MPQQCRSCGGLCGGGYGNKFCQQEAAKPERHQGKRLDGYMRVFIAAGKTPAEAERLAKIIIQHF